MDDLRRRVLRDNRLMILKELGPERVLDHMYQSGTFGEDDCDHVKKAGTRRERGQEFLTILPRRGNRAYDVFLEGLDQEQLSHLAEKLRSYEAELRREETSVESFDGVDKGFEEASSATTPAVVSGCNVEQGRAPRQRSQWSVRHGSGTNHPVSPAAGSYCPVSGTNYSVYPSAGSYSPVSGTNYRVSPTADSYCPGSGTNYPVSPATFITGSSSDLSDNSHVGHDHHRDTGIDDDD